MGTQEPIPSSWAGPISEPPQGPTDVATGGDKCLQLLSWMSLIWTFRFLNSFVDCSTSEKPNIAVHLRVSVFGLRI